MRAHTKQRKCKMIKVYKMIQVRNSVWIIQVKLQFVFLFHYVFSAGLSLDLLIKKEGGENRKE